MALQRTFSGFPSGCPGLALLLLRFGVGGTSGLQSALLIAATHYAAANTIAAALAIITSLALIIGLMTPIATTLLCLGGLAATIHSEMVGYMPLFESWIARFEFIVMSAALICLGPGAFSLDARLYGRREIEVNGNGS
jgi:ABC-type Na+ efflux pump permease subunit